LPWQSFEWPAGVPGAGETHPESIDRQMPGSGRFPFFDFGQPPIRSTQVERQTRFDVHQFWIAPGRLHKSPQVV
jgi:hypothetical protein